MNQPPRPTREQLFLAMADLMSSRGTCQRLQTGAIITSIDNRVISTGYNGPLHETYCEMKCYNIEDRPCEHAIHAEANAIYAAAKYGIALKGAIMYSTTSPCLKCAEAIVQAGIGTLFYSKDYRLPEGLFLLKKEGIKVVKYE